jgi:transcriptional regulator with XRE-family HTH domain
MEARMGEFGDELTKARHKSRYPHRVDLAERARVSPSTYEKYEVGTRFPSKEALERVLTCGAFSPEAAQHLRKVHNEEHARRKGIDLGLTRFSIDVSDLARKIQNDIEYELKRAHGHKTSTHTRNVCIRRIELRLRNSLENG